jgi:predicted ATP-dependent serine protease
MVVRRMSSPAFVGRRSELAALDAVLARAGKGDGSAVLVEGEAGIGKSRLMARLESRGRAAGLSIQDPGPHRRGMARLSRGDS